MLVTVLRTSAPLPRERVMTEWSSLADGNDGGESDVSRSLTTYSLLLALAYRKTSVAARPELHPATSVQSVAVPSSYDFFLSVSIHQAIQEVQK